MRESTRLLLENLPNGYKFENNELKYMCDDCGKWVTTEIRQRNIFEGSHRCKSCGYKYRSKLRINKSALQAQETFKTHPWLRIDMINRKVECRCKYCENWFEINYFHDCGRFLQSDNHYCDLHKHIQGAKISANRRHERFIESLILYAKKHPNTHKMCNDILFCLCDHCKNWYKVDLNNISYHISHEKHICHNCYNKEKGQRISEYVGHPGICHQCGESVEELLPGYLCKNCHKKKNKKLSYLNTIKGNCTICGSLVEHRDGAGRCVLCASKAAIDIRSSKYCKKCDEITPHNGSFCLFCHPESINHKGGNFIQNFCIKNGREYYFDCKIQNYVPWLEFKEKFIISNIDFKLPDGFQLHSTFREQNSLDWSGAKQAFERSLIDNGIGWFVYIKFYIDSKNSLKPLVVGKTGSKLVNQNGTDISFSTDINHGPARRFLHDENLQWCKTQIAVKQCHSENEAYELENQLLHKLHLFGS